CATCPPFSDGSHSRRHGHVRLLVDHRATDRTGRRHPHRASGNAAGGRAGASNIGCRRGRHHESRPQSAENPPRTGKCWQDRARHLCRAWHHGGKRLDAPCRKERCSCALFLPHSGCRLARPPRLCFSVGSGVVSGSLAIIGLGPGSTNQITPEAGRAVANAQFFYGYKPYVDRLALRSDQHAIASDNREELARAKEALEKAAAGHRVAVVSGGDPGVFAMAAAVCEAIESGPEEWRALDLTIVPGITAMLAVAARIGAPLGNAFCA